MVVCRAAQEAGAPHREYIYRKKENVIFTPLYLDGPLSDYDYDYILGRDSTADN